MLKACEAVVKAANLCREAVYNYWSASEFRHPSEVRHLP